MICEFVKTACDKECAVFKIIMSITPCAEPVDGDTTGSVALSTLPTPNAQVQCESWHQSTKVCQVCAIVSVLGRAPLLSAKNIKELEDSQPRRALNSPWASYLLAMQGKVAGQTTNDGPLLDECSSRELKQPGLDIHGFMASFCLSSFVSSNVSD